VDALLSVDDVAELLGVTKQRIYVWRHEGKGPPAIQLEGRMLRYRLEDLENYLATQRDGDSQRGTAAGSTRSATGRRRTNDDR
jgi:excisionase family DNA binding protein